MVQLNATYRNIEESIGRLLPQQTKEQLSLLENLVRYVRPSRSSGTVAPLFCLPTQHFTRTVSEAFLTLSFYFWLR